MKSRKTAILGGSFDPVHLGHLFLLHCAVSMTDYKNIIIIPAKVSNFKQSSAPKASDDDRLNMLSLALEDYRDLYPMDSDAEISISTIELDRGGVSYTSDTIRELYSRYSTDRIGLIMGDDHIRDLSHWHDFEYLRDNVRFLICKRNPEGTPWDLIPEGVSYIKLEPDVLARQSSSAIRNDHVFRSEYLSERVYEYVRRHSLYD